MVMKMKIAEFDTLFFDIPEFSKLYREFSNAVKEGRYSPVRSTAWRRIKQQLVNNKRLIQVSVELNCINLHEVNKEHTYHQDTTEGLTEFISFIYDKYMNLTDLCSTLESTSKICNCMAETAVNAATIDNTITTIGDLVKGVSINGNSIGTDSTNIYTNKTDGWSIVGVNDMHEQQLKEHADRLSHQETRMNENESMLASHERRVTAVEAGFCDNESRINTMETKLNDRMYGLEYDLRTISDATMAIDDFSRENICNLKAATEHLECQVDYLMNEFNKLRDEIDKSRATEESNNDSENKENSFMKNFVDFKFGKVVSDDVRMSMYGIAIKNVDGRYVSWDAKSHSVMDVEVMNMPSEDFLYLMPVAIKDVKAGDVVIHNRVPMFVVEVHASTLKVIDIREGAEKEIYLTKSPFGFNFATKVISLFNMTGSANENMPFGNMLPLMLMGDGKMDNLLPLMLMSGQNGFGDFASNPMMLYFMMKDGKDSDMLPLMMMMNMNQPTKKE